MDTPRERRSLERHRRSAKLGRFKPIAEFDWNFALAEHPFLCEIPSRSSGNRQVRVSRLVRKWQEIGLLLNLLLEHGVRLVSNRVQHAWALLPEECGDERTQFVQLGYEIPDLETAIDGLSDHPNPPALETAGPDDHYARWCPTVGTSLRIAEDAAQLSETFFRLSKPDWVRFLNALYCFRQGLEVSVQSSSVSYVCMINAVEAVLESGWSKGKCSECQQDHRESIRSRFRRFLKVHVPEAICGSDSRDDLYDKRNSVAHGGRFRIDDRYFLDLQPKTHEEENRVRQGQVVVRYALIDWLRTRES